MFAFCTARINAAILCFSQTDAVQIDVHMLGQIWMQFSTQMLRPLRVDLIENGFHWTVRAAEPVDDGLRPIKVVLTPLQVPI